MAIFRLKPKNDFVFGRLFGARESKESLRALLNAILRQDGQEPIVDLDVKEQKKLDKLTFDEKTGILDIRAELASGEQVNIEMQMTKKGNMIPRSLFYLSKLFVSSIRSGQDYNKLKKTIVINLLDFDLLTTNRFHSTFHLYEDMERNQLLTDLFEVHFIEFPKFERITKDKHNELHRWLMFMDEKLPEEELRELMEMDPIIEVTEEQLEGMSRDEFLQRAAEIREKAQLDWNSSISYAKREGKAEGKAEGRAEVISKFLEKGMTEAQVSELMDISLEEVRRIAKPAD